MVDLLRRLWKSENLPPPAPAEPLTLERIDTGYRLYWTKIAMPWDTERREMIAQRVAAVLASPDFEQTALERRFQVEGLDDQAHSGASLRALAEVLVALDNFETNSDNQE